jgi:ribosomal protein S18 acetylase RimI-like enzyme
VPPEFTIRVGTLDDVEIVVAQRRGMFLDMGHADDDAMRRMCEAFHPWLERKMRAGEYLAWFAVDGEGAIAAGLGLWLMDWPPHMLGPGPWRGNILNVYTRPESRRLGLARRLMDTALAWCLLAKVRAVILHSSEDGRRLYESLGFTPTNEMRILLNFE